MRKVLLSTSSFLFFPLLLLLVDVEVFNVGVGVPPVSGTPEIPLDVSGARHNTWRSGRTCLSKIDMSYEETTHSRVQ